MIEKLHVSWKTLEEDTTLLVKKLKDSNLPKDTELVCITRGGLFIGGLLSYSLGIKNIHTVALSSYVREENHGNEEVKLLKWGIPYGEHFKNDTPLLFVDDINDTSKTYQYVLDECKRRGLSNVRFATTYHKARESNLTPDFIGKDLDPECWVVFPWDKLEG